MTQLVAAAAVQATTQGAGLVIFPEAFVPTYPDWVWRAPAWSDHNTLRYFAPDGSLAERARRLHTEPFPNMGGVTSRATDDTTVSADYGAVSTVT